MQKLLLLIALIFVMYKTAYGQLEFEKLAGPAGFLWDINIASDLHGHYLWKARDEYRYMQSDDGIHWSDIHPARSGAVYAGLNGRFYNVSKDSFFISEDQGFSWQTVRAHAIISQASYFAADRDGRCWITPDYNKIYTSSDEGLTWQLVFSATNSSEWTIKQLTINPYTQEAWLLQRDGKYWRVLKAGLDGSVSQVFSFSKLHDTYKPHLVFGPDGATYVNNAEADENSTVWRTIDGGTSWQPIGTNGYMYNFFAAFTVTSTGRYYVKGHYSDDGGMIWKPVSEPWKNYFDHLVAMPDGKIFGLGYNLFQSGNDGVDWHFAGYNLGDEYLIKDIAFVDTQQFYVSANYGLYKTEDGGKTFRFLTTAGYPQYFTGNIFTNSKGWLYANLQCSKDGGEHFETVFQEDPFFYNIFWNIDANDNIYINCGDDFYFSEDDGLTWTLTGTHTAANYAYKMIFTPAGDIFWLNHQWVRRSQDHGKTFEDIGQGLNFSYVVPGLHGRIWAQDYRFGLMWSDDRGTTWQPSDHLPANIWSTDFCEFNSGFRLISGFQMGSWPHNPSQIFAACNEKCNWLSTGYGRPNLGGSNFAAGADGKLYLFNRDGLHRVVIPADSIQCYFGQVLQDLDLNCEPSSPDRPLPFTQVKLHDSGRTSYSYTNDEGYFYSLKKFEGVNGEAVLNRDFWQQCNDITTADAGDTLIIMEQPKIIQPNVEITVAVPQFRRCFNNTYFVNCCNTGSEAALGFVLRVIPDPFLTFVKSDQPLMGMTGDTLLFDLGTIEMNSCKAVGITFNISCDAPLGQLHCTEFIGTVNDSIITPTRAQLSARGSCSGQQAHFTIANDGLSMNGPRNYRIFDDKLQILKSGTFQLLAGETLNFDVDSTRAELNFQGENDHNNLWDRYFGTTLTNCLPTLVDRAASSPWQDNITAWQETICKSNVGSYDPNDKQAFPKGFTEAHHISPSQTLSYMIRFQNTGTDTAFTVMIEDELSDGLDPATLKAGPSSHPYQILKASDNKFQFWFRNIMLPDSNRNEADSHGFLYFTVQQNTGNPDGKIIRNKADIYFDFNDAVQTNEVWHTVGIPFKTLPSLPSQTALPTVTANPNPFGEAIRFVVEQTTQEQFTLLIFDFMGRKMDELSFTGADYIYQTPYLPAGAYFYKVSAENGEILGKGTITRQ